MGLAQRVKPGNKVKLKDYNANADGGISREEGEARFEKLNLQLEELQEELYAAGMHSVLIVLQGMDTSGKDGTIRKVFEHINPQGCQVASFKVPTPDELSHDFLWRVHQQVPARGMMTIFNRSHYEDVLVVRVKNLVPKPVWKARFEQINQFEGLLAANGTLIFKFFLHISKDEQEQRLIEREQDVEKAWKLSVGDWKERAFWDDYQSAYEDVLSKCSTDIAPWHVIPANRKWFRDLAIADVLVEGLSAYRNDWLKKLAKLSKERLAELQSYRAELEPKTS
jgi:PPK2 family polyphosphate:nucleotide phosphotransferase